jgi:hypothetical protein
VYCRRRAKKPNKFVYAHRNASADIVDVASLAAVHRREQGIDRVAHEDEVSFLFTISDYREWFPRKQLRQEDPENGSIRAARACARPIDVEQAHRNDG